MVKIDDISKVVEQLSSVESLSLRTLERKNCKPMPSVDTLTYLVSKLRTVLFPGYFGETELSHDNLHYSIGYTLDKLSGVLKEQVIRGYDFVCEEEDSEQCRCCEEKADTVVSKFFGKLPEIRRLLITDAMAAFEGDPAAKSPSEAVFCYPSMRAVINHRIAHELYKLEVPLIPRIISECAHSETGIDIHPGATIGERFFMDHGTGIVIGETSIIGNNVRIYQGVTLGAKSFPLDNNGQPVKGIDRHPIVEDNVIIYSGATILGRITIGKGTVIGGNVWLTKSVPPGMMVNQGDTCNVSIKKSK